MIEHVIYPKDLKRVYFTQIESCTPVVKTYLSDGSKQTGANIFKGRYFMRSVSGLVEFDDYLNKLRQNDTITLGVTKYLTGDLVTNKALETEQGINLISRSKRYIGFLNDMYPICENNIDYSLYIFDIDFSDSSPDSFKLSSPEEIRNALIKIAPMLALVQMLIRSSSSSNIKNIETGDYRNSSKSYHVYIIVANSTDKTVSDFTEYLKRRCWLTDYAYMTTNGVGVRDKYILDFAVPSAERLIVESLPITYYPFQKEFEVSTIYDGGVLDLSTIDFSTEPDYREKSSHQKQLLKDKDLKNGPEKTKTFKANSFNNDSISIPTSNDTEIIISDDTLNNVSAIYNYFKSAKYPNIKKVKQYFNDEIVKAILTFFGYQIDYNYKFKFRPDEKNASACIKDCGLITDFGINKSWSIVNFIMDIYDLDFITSWKYIQNLFGKSYRIKSVTSFLPNPKDFEKRLTNNKA